MKQKIYLSPPYFDDREKEAVAKAIDSGWLAPAGPALLDFESQLEDFFGRKKALMLNSGTSALHLSLILGGVGPGDTVVTSTMTFAACANVILYQGAKPIFIDSEEDTWNMDPLLLEEYLHGAQVLPKAIIVTHLYGVPAKLMEIVRVAHKFEVSLVEDAAEALGAQYQDKPVGTFGDFGVISFNGNKIVTTSAGGALICKDETTYAKGLHLATQANTGVGEYHHDQLGYNYRMSNVLAALGMSQFGKLNSFLSAKKTLFEEYREQLGPYLVFPEELSENQSNHWLTVALFKTSNDPMELVKWLESHGIESRRLWKPLHLHPAFDKYQAIGNECSERLFERGICLPSGSGLSHSDQQRVIETIKSFFSRIG